MFKNHNLILGYDFIVFIIVFIIFFFHFKKYYLKIQIHPRVIFINIFDINFMFMFIIKQSEYSVVILKYKIVWEIVEYKIYR
jgi:hypothetical protein